MNITWTATQKQRLGELNADEALADLVFADTASRETRFRELEKELAAQSRRDLVSLKEEHRRPLLLQLESSLARWLREQGFVQVVAPLVL